MFKMFKKEEDKNRKAIDKFMKPIISDVRKFAKQAEKENYSNFVIALGKLKKDEKEPLILLDSLFGGDLGFLVRVTEVLLENPEIRTTLIQKNILAIGSYNGNENFQ